MTLDSETSRIYFKQPKQTQKRKCCIMEPDLEIKVPMICKPTQDSEQFKELAKEFELKAERTQALVPETFAQAAQDKAATAAVRTQKAGKSRKQWQIPKLPKFRLSKAFDVSRFIENLNGKLVYAASLAVVGTLVFGSVYASGIRMGYGVYVEGERVGSVSSKEVVASALSKAENKIEEVAQNDYKVDAVEVKVEFVKEDTVKDTDTLENEILKQVDCVSEAAAIYVDGEFILAVADENAAKNLIDLLIDRQKQSLGDDNAAVTIKNDVKVETELVANEKISGLQDAATALLGTREKLIQVTAGESDTFWSIAEGNGIPVETLIAANPGIDPETLQAGMVLNLNKPQSLLTFKSEQVIDYVEEVPFGTEEVKDDTTLVGTKTVATPGVAGQTAFKAVLVKENGVEVEKRILEENVIAEPVNEVVKIGSKEPEVKTATVATTSVSSSGFIRPYMGTLTSRYGGRSRGFHTGVDWCGKTGDPVVASASGTVTFAGWSGGYGYLVKISHPNGYETYYAHNSSILVSKGQTVAQGQVIAKLGSTGNSTGPHCHFEIRKNGQTYNPLNFVN